MLHIKTASGQMFSIRTPPLAVLLVSKVSMKTFPLTLTLVLLALQGMEAKVNNCLNCIATDANSTCASHVYLCVLYLFPCLQAHHAS